MRSPTLPTIALGALVVAASLSSARPARAAVACSSLPNPLYLQIGDTQEPLIKALGQKLRNSTVNPMTLVYLTAGSCTNIDAIYNGTKLTQNPYYVPSTAEDPTWDPSQPSIQCTIDPAGVPIDVANSNVFVSTCTQAATPAGLGLFQGPVQPYVFVVPEASTQQAITAEEAYFVFGFGQNGGISPWTDESLFFIRPATKSTLLTMAYAIDVPASKWKGVPLDKSSQVLNSVATSTDPEKTIGILGVEICDANRASVNALAFRAFQQKYAYYPDSTATSFDKQNVRDGHYLPWSPTVYITAIDGQGIATNPRAKYVIDMILSRTVTPAPDFDPLSIVIAKNLVPDCAMKVTRSSDGGDLSLYAPAEAFGNRRSTGRARTRTRPRSSSTRRT